MCIPQYILQQPGNVIMPLDKCEKYSLPYKCDTNHITTKQFGYYGYRDIYIIRVNHGGTLYTSIINNMIAIKSKQL